MGSATTICSYEQACSRHRWDVPDGYNIAAHAFAYCCITGWVWALSDSQGRFEFKTIRPAAYPNRDIPGHIHLSFVTACCGRQTSEVMFDDDPLATKDYRERQAEGVMFGKITKRPDGSQETSYTFRLKARGEF